MLSLALFRLPSGNPKISTPVISSVAQKAKAVNLIHCPSLPVFGGFGKER
jgi:hypothetical protein